MTFSVSPGVYTREQDFTAQVQSQLTSNGSFAGVFTWGPVLERVRVSGEADLVNRFGRPDKLTNTDFLTASSFLAYSSALDVVRVGNTTVMKNAVSSGTAIAILNDAAYSQTAPGLSTIAFVAKYPGLLGNSIAVAVCTSANEFERSLPGSFTFPVAPRSKVIQYTAQAAENLSDYFNLGDFLVVDGVKYSVLAINDTLDTLTIDKLYTGVATPTTIKRRWQYADIFGFAPGTDRAHIIVLDNDGKFKGAAGSVLSTLSNVSTIAGTKYEDGTSAYFIDVVNTTPFIRAGGAGLTGINATNKITTKVFTGGVDGTASIGDDDYLAGYGLYSNALEVDAPLIIGGARAVTSTSKVIGSYIIESIAEVRKDSVAFVSPAMDSVVNNAGDEATSIVADRNALPRSSYGHMDGNWKYMYDKYNDIFIWVPVCGDSAGIYARTDLESETWFSGAGVTRGRIKNVVKFAWNPDETRRDVLYPNDINPVLDLPGYGPVLYGDKTLRGGISAFTRMNVRRLFILLEKTISRFAALSLFEVNDEFTQRRFVSGVEPFLRAVKGNRGLESFLIVCDDTVNTPAVKAANQFVGKVLVRPLFSINSILLDFAAVAGSVTFEEVIGA